MYGISFRLLKRTKFRVVVQSPRLKSNCTTTKFLCNLTFGLPEVKLGEWLVVWHVDLLLVARVVVTAWAVDFA